MLLIVCRFTVSLLIVLAMQTTRIIIRTVIIIIIIMTLKISSININGFRSKHKQYIIKQFVKENKVDILFVQETFVDNNYLAKAIEL